MGIMSWIFYIMLGIMFFIIIGYLNSKYSLNKIQSLIFSILLLMIVSGFCFRIRPSVCDNIFLSFVFLMLSDVIYSSYFVERDFFNKSEKKLLYYIFLIIVGFFINQEFINQVDSVFLTGSDLRIVLWFLIFIFLYSFFKDKNIMMSSLSTNSNNISINTILNCYARYKYTYFDECNVEDKELSNALYAIMIYEGNKRSRVLRNLDNFFFRVDGKSRKLGIMQIETRKFITDSESIELVRCKLEELYKDKKNKDINSLFDNYYGYDNSSVKYIFEIIKKM